MNRQRPAAASRINRRARPVEIEDVRQSIRRDRQRVARAHVGVDVLVVVVVRHRDFGVVGATDADEHAGP